MGDGAAPSADGRRLTADGFLLGAAAFFGVFVFRARAVVDGVTYFPLFDDAMVSMRYARNLASGDGLVWNPGEVPVEGFTNPLWTLWMALLHLTGVPEAKVGLLVALTSAALLLVQLALVRRVAHETAESSPAAADAAVILVALFYPMAFWSLRGMEVGALSCAVVGATLLALRLREEWTPRRALALAALLGAIPLIRMDGALPAAIVAAFAAGWAAPGRRRRAALVLGGAIVASLALQTAARLAYYGDALPNTYYLKMTGVPLAERLAQGLFVLRQDVLHELWPLLLLAALAGPRSARHPRTLLIVLALGQLAYSVWVGGDAWEWMRHANRYVTVAAPALAVLAALGIPELHRVLRALVAGLLGRPRVAVPAATATGVRLTALALALLVSGRPLADWIETGGAHVADDARRVEAGLRVRDATSPDAVIAVVWAGTLPYYAQRGAVDLLGKNDRAIARLPAREPWWPGHGKWDIRHSIGGQRPDVVLELWRWSPADFAYLAALGYERPGGGPWVRRDSRAVDRARLADGLRGLQRGGILR